MKQKTGWKTGHKIFLAFVALCILATVLISKNAKPAPTVPDAPALTAVQQDSINHLQHLDSFTNSAYKENIQSFLEKTVNDPTGLQIMQTWIIGENKDGTFAVKAEFRAKNAFGALMIHTVNCDMDIPGNSKNIVYDK